MATNSVEKISAGKPNSTGGVYAGPTTATLPVDATAAIDATILPLGLVSEDGLAAGGERNVEAIKDWSGDIIAQLQTEHSSNFTFTLYQVYDGDVQKIAFGDANVTVTAATASTGTLITVEETGTELPYKAFVFDMKNGDKKARFVLPNARVTTVEELDYVAGSLQGFTLTVEAFKDENGVKVYRYYDDGVFTA